MKKSLLLLPSMLILCVLGFAIYFLTSGNTEELGDLRIKSINEITDKRQIISIAETAKVIPVDSHEISIDIAKPSEHKVIDEVKESETTPFDQKTNEAILPLSETIDGNIASMPLETKQQIAEVSNPEKENVVKKIYFVNKKDEPIFNGPSILAKNGYFKVNDTISIEISGLSDEMARLKLISKKYFLIKSDETLLLNFSTSQDGVLPIELGEYCRLEVLIKSKAGNLDIKDGEAANLRSNFSVNLSGTVENQKAIFQVREPRILNVLRFSAGKYAARFNKQVEFIEGKTTQLEIEAEEGVTQKFKVIDSQGVGLSGFAVLLFKEPPPQWQIQNMRKKFISKEDSFFVGSYSVTNSEGIAILTHIVPGEHFAYAFGKGYTEKEVKVNIMGLDEIVELQFDGLEGNRIQLNLLLDGLPYQNEIEVTYYDLKEPSSIEKYLTAKIENGTLEINGLKNSKYKFQLKSHDFDREAVEIDFAAGPSLNHTFQLKKSEYFIHGYAKDTSDKPVPNMKISVAVNDYRLFIWTDEKGYFKFGGAAKDVAYGWHFYSDLPMVSKKPNRVYASTELVNITFGSNVMFSGEVFDEKGKPLEKYKLFIKAWQNEKLSKYLDAYTRYPETNKFTVEVKDFGYYDVHITVPGKPEIHKIVKYSIENQGEIFRFDMAVGFKINGSISDYAGNILEGVSVTKEVFRTPNILSTGNIRNVITTSNPQGEFALVNCLVGEEYWFAKVGYAPLKYEIKENDSLNMITLKFIKTYSLTGTIKNSKGTPHKKIQVVGRLNNTREYMVVVYGNEEGNFKINSITPGKWYFYFRIELKANKQFPGKWITIKEEGDNTLDFVYDLAE